jgi:hypothetical protein
MKILIAISLLLAGPALAQDTAAVPQVCKDEAQRLCSDRNLKQECLVLNWTRLSDACQDALKVPMKDGD